MSEATAKRWAGILAGVLIMGLVLAIAGVTPGAPPDWLLEWTSWVGTAVTIVLAPILASAAAQALHKLARG